MATATETTAPTANETPQLDLSALLQAGAGRVLRTISRNCMVLQIRVRGIGLERKLDDAEVKVEGEEVPDEFLSGARIWLTPPEVHGPLARIANRARALPGQFGTRFLNSAALVPNFSCARLFAAIQATREEYTNQARALVPAWEAHKEKLRKDRPHQYDRIKKDLVDGEAFVNKHQIQVVPFPIGTGLPDDFERIMTGWVQGPEFARFASRDEVEIIKTHLPHILAKVSVVADTPRALGENQGHAWAIEARKAMDQAIAESVRTMIQDPLDEFAKALANMEATLRRGSNIRSGGIDAVRRAHDKLAGFRFLADGQLQQRLDRVARELEGLTPQQLNGARNRDAALGLSEFLKQTREEMAAESTHQSVYEQFLGDLDV